VKKNFLQGQSRHFGGAASVFFPVIHAYTRAGQITGSKVI